MTSQRFTAMAVAVGRERVTIPAPFDPNQIWGRKDRRHVHGAINGRRMRSVIEPSEPRGFTLRVEMVELLAAGRKAR